MENTTKMYIEHIVIGMQTTILILFVFLCLEPSLKSYLQNVSLVMEFFIVIPIAYALGILIDRISKLIIGSKKLEENANRQICMEILAEKTRLSVECNNGSNCKNCELNVVSRQVWKEFDEMDYYNDARTRKRILRASCFNSAFAFLVILILFLLKKNFLSQISSIVLLVFLFAIAIGCFLMYRTLILDYYNKQKKYIHKKLK